MSHIDTYSLGKHLILTVLVLLFSAQMVSAQILSGKVLDNIDNSPIPAAQLLNINTGRSSQTSEDGSFEIGFSYGDTLRISVLGYKTIDRALLLSGKSAYRQNFYLVVAPEMLDEFVVDSRSQYQRDSSSRVALYEHHLARKGERVTGAAAVMSPATAIAQMFSAKSKQRAKFIANFSKWETEKFASSRYTPELVHEITKLTGDSLLTFMYIFPIADDFARAATEIELKMWIKYSFLEFIDPQNKERYKSIKKLE